MSFVPGIGGHQLHMIQNHSQIHIVTGQGDSRSAARVATVLDDVVEPRHLEQPDVWGHDMKHDWPTWRAMLPYYLSGEGRVVRVGILVGRERSLSGCAHRGGEIVAASA